LSPIVLALRAIKSGSDTGPSPLGDPDIVFLPALLFSLSALRDTLADESFISISQS
jgi:hypothetical protein